jgi:ATP-binding protein involved in chromosome partitioning
MTADAQVDPPLSIRRDHDAGVLHIAWRDGLEVAIKYPLVRVACSCARCVDEVTGRRLIDITDIDPLVEARELQAVGAYAVRIQWSDGHNTGLYTWPQFRQLSEQAAANSL